MFLTTFLGAAFALSYIFLVIVFLIRSLKVDLPDWSTSIEFRSFVFMMTIGSGAIATLLAIAVVGINITILDMALATWPIPFLIGDHILAETLETSSFVGILSS